MYSFPVPSNVLLIPYRLGVFMAYIRIASGIIPDLIYIVSDAYAFLNNDFGSN